MATDTKSGGERQFTPRARRVSLRPPGLQKPSAPPPPPPAKFAAHEAVVRSLVELWKRSVIAPRRRLILAAIVLLVTGTMLVARGGTDRARALAATVLFAAFCALVLFRRRERSIFGSTKRTIDRVAGRAAPE